MSAPGRRLVIDASVALAADSQTESCAGPSRQFLQSLVKDTSHVAVMTEELEAEWRQRDTPENPSVWAVPWLLAMRRKSRVLHVDDTVKARPPNGSKLETKLQRVQTSAAVLQAMLEDMHLIEAALVTDQTVVSADKKVRKYFSQAAQSIAALQEIVWVNPCIKEEAAAAWLRQGAPADPVRKLRFKGS